MKLIPFKILYQFIDKLYSNRSYHCVDSMEHMKLLKIPDTNPYICTYTNLQICIQTFKGVPEYTAYKE